MALASVGALSSLALSDPASAAGGAGGGLAGGGGGADSLTGTGDNGGNQGAAGGGGGGAGAGAAGGDGANGSGGGSGGGGGLNPGDPGEPGDDSPIAGSGGGGGAHGGVVINGIPSGPLEGGAGGKGGNGQAPGPTTGGGGGGAGGYGAVSVGPNLVGTISGALTGGKGGDGGTAASTSIVGTSGGGGGTGGHGYVVVDPDNGVTVNAAITGGNGGAGGAVVSGSTGVGGAGGNGGDGLLFMTTGDSVTVNAAISGGDGGTGGAAPDMAGAHGQGGTGIVGQDLSVTVGSTGSVTGGFAGGGGAQANAITFAAGSNILTLHGGATVSGTVSGVGADTLELGGAAAGTFDVSRIGATAQYQGFATFEKTGSSTWSLTSNNTDVLPWTVKDGTLRVNADLANSPFTVDDGGTLGGTGDLGAVTINSGGVYAPGNSIGIQRVNGDLRFLPGAQLDVEVNARGESDRVVVAGTVDLTGATLRVLAENGAYRPVTEYLIIDNDGSDAVQGEFGAVFANLAFLTPQVSYHGGDGNDVVLTMIRTATPGHGFVSFCSVATTRNQCNVAQALDHFPTDHKLFLAVLSQTADGARAAFDALSGEIHATLPALLADDSRYVREAVLGRLMQASYTGQLAPLAANGPQLASLDARAMTVGADSEAMRLSSGKSLAMPPADPGLAFWTRAYGAWGDFDGNGNAASAERDLGGFVSGLDSQVSGTWRIGVAAGGAWSNVSIGARHSSAEVESFHLAAYAGGMAGPLALRAGGGYAWQDIETSRAVIFPGFFERQDASYDADTGQIFGEIAYPIASGGIALEPFAGLAYVNVDTGRVRERGGVLSALGGSANEQDVGYSTLGLRAATSLHWGSTLVVPKVSAAWQHAFDDVTPGAALAFLSTGIGFGITGVPLAEDSLLIEAGLDFALSPTATFGVSYSGQLASEVSDNAVSGRLTWLF